MLILGLLLPICYLAGITGATIPTQWALLSCVLPFGLWRGGNITPLHWLGGLFIAYAALSALWATNYHTSVYGLWIVFLWGLSFWLGSTLPTLAQLWRGLALGLSISSAVAVAQALGYHPVEVAQGQNAGLLYNPSVQGSCIALVLIALATHRLWWYMPPLLIGLALVNSRGALLLLALAGTAQFFGKFATLALLTIAAAFFTNFIDHSDVMRLQIWGTALSSLSMFGYGPDSFADVYILIHNTLVRPEFTHNDYLQFWFEYGIGALAPFAILALALAVPGPNQLPLFAFAILGTFYFPLHTPITAFIGCALAGHASRDWSRHGAYSDDWRYRVLSWFPNAQPGPNRTGLAAVPMVPRTSHTEA